MTIFAKSYWTEFKSDIDISSRFRLSLSMLFSSGSSIFGSEKWTFFLCLLDIFSAGKLNLTYKYPF